MLIDIYFYHHITRKVRSQNTHTLDESIINKFLNIILRLEYSKYNTYIEKIGYVCIYVCSSI